MSQETETTNETAEETPMMGWRELAGAINRAKKVWVYVHWGPAGEDEEGEAIGEDYIQVSKESVRAIVERAKETKTKIAAELDGRELYIGPCDDEGEPDGETEPEDGAPEDEPEEEEELDEEEETE